MLSVGVVLLSDRAATLEVQGRALAEVCGGGQIIEWRGGEVTSLVGGNGENLLTVHAPKMLQDVVEAAAAVGRAELPYQVWTEMKLPFKHTSRSRELALAIAARVGGVIEEMV